MITISSLHTESIGDEVKLVARIQVSSQAIEKWKEKSALIDTGMKNRYRSDYLDENQNFDMWYKVAKKYEDALCTERGDAFVVACLYFAMVIGEDIKCTVPVTERLMYQLKEYIIPVMCDEKRGYKKINIYADTLSEIKKTQNFVGTGISCGVDSLSTVLLHLKPEITDQFKLTHLAVFNTGSLNFDGYSKDKPLSEWRKETLVELKNRSKLGEQVADELGLAFIEIDSNVGDLYQGCFLKSHTYRNLSAVMATQKMWGVYYYASAGLGPDLVPGLTRDSGEFDGFLTSLFSLGNLVFYVGGEPYKRLAKTELIADNPVVQKHINVCSYYTKNCGKCSKCIRTLSALDLLGKLDEFSESFEDMSYYKKNRWKIRALISEAKPSDHFNYEMKEYMEEHHIPLELKSKIYHYLLPLRMVWIWLHRIGRN